MSLINASRFSRAAILFLSLAFLTACQTQFYTSWAVTKELLTVHSALCPKVPFDIQRSKIVFFSDFHRGLGSTDEFKKNKTLFVKILSHYYEKGYTLVLNGDMEEGWGYQRDNIPLILDDHREEVEVEKKFLKDHRYYRIYGNHDDFYRGRSLVFDDGSSTRVYPAVLFVQDSAGGRPFSILVTHGCQGHGLHDAGDDVAAWGVSVKYLWLLETGKKNVRTDRQAGSGLEKEKTKYEKHERYVLDWAFGDALRKPCTILIGGHTHRPIFESQFDPKWVSIVLRDYESGAKKAASGPFEDESAEPGAGAASRKQARTAYEKRMIETLRKMEAAAAAPLQIGAKKKGAPTLGPTYFNTGCGFFSEIPCLEIADGHIRLVYIKLDNSGRLVFDPKGDASLEKYL